MESVLQPPAKLGIAAAAPAHLSAQWFERARKVLAGGISSSARATTSGPRRYPLYMTRGEGAHLWDANGHEFIDYLLTFGSCVRGHANPEITRALHHQVDEGTMFGTCNTLEVELAEQICRMVPHADLVRYANSGSEAILGAIRAARGFTGKTRIVKFEGHYHGWVDQVAVSNRPDAKDIGPLVSPSSVPHSRGIPSGMVSDVIICPWNQPAILRQILDAHEGEIAAVIAEPIVANNACIMPQEGFLQILREECTRRGLVLIFDEIVTGFRTRPGGAQQLFGINADISVFSKALGGGLPISAFAGKRSIMQLIGENSVKHGGTYNGNPLCAAAALATLQTLENPQRQRQMAAHGQLLMDSIRRAASDCCIPCCVQGPGAMFQVIFNADGAAPLHFRDLYAAQPARYAAFQAALLEAGVFVTPSHMACWFISTAHTDEDIERTAAAIAPAMKRVAQI